MIPILIFRLAELRVVGGDHEVAHHGQFAAATQREAGHGRDHGLADRADGFPVAGDEVFLVDVGEGEFRHGRNVGTGGKGFFAAGDDHAADGLIGVEGLQCGTEFVHQGAVERVECLRPVQRDDADFFGLDTHLDQFISHGLSPGFLLKGWGVA
jgi:hypothetical protein